MTKIIIFVICIEKRSVRIVFEKQLGINCTSEQMTFKYRRSNFHEWRRHELNVLK